MRKMNCRILAATLLAVQIAVTAMPATALAAENDQIQETVKKERAHRMQELAEEPYIQLETGELSEPIEAFHALGLEPDIELRMHDNFSVCTMVEAGIGVSVMPNLALKKMNYDIVILPTEPMVKRKVAFAMKKKELLPIASQRFIDFFMESIRTFPVV